MCSDKLFVYCAVSWAGMPTLLIILHRYQPFGRPNSFEPLFYTQKSKLFASNKFESPNSPSIYGSQLWPVAPENHTNNTRYILQQSPCKFRYILQQQIGSSPGCIRDEPHRIDGFEPGYGFAGRLYPLLLMIKINTISIRILSYNSLCGVKMNISKKQSGSELLVS